MVVAVLVGYEERAFNFTSIRVESLVVEDFPVVVVIVQVDGTVEREKDHLWRLQVIYLKLRLLGEENDVVASFSYEIVMERNDGKF